MLVEEIIVIEKASPSDRFTMPVPYSLRGTPLFNSSKLVMTMYKTLPRDEAIKARIDEIERLKDRFRLTHLNRHLEFAFRWCSLCIFPLITLLTGAYIFKLILQIGSTRHASLSKQADDVFLYYVTAAFFWNHLVGRVGNECFKALEFYFRPTFDEIGNAPRPWWINPLLFYLYIILGTICLVWSVIILKRTCQGLRNIFGLAPARRWYRLWSGGYRMCFNLLTSTITGGAFGILVVMILAISYAYTRLWLIDLVKG